MTAIETFTASVNERPRAFAKSHYKWLLAWGSSQKNHPYQDHPDFAAIQAAKTLIAAGVFPRRPTR